MSGVRKFAKIAMNLDAWTVAYVGGMATKPSYAHIQLIDKFVKTTKSILSAKADVFYFGNINNSNDSFRNLIKNSHHGTIQGSNLVFDNLVGFTNPQGTGWVDTNYNPSTQGVKYTLNDAGIGVNFESKFTNPYQIILSLYDGIEIASIWNYNNPTYITFALNNRGSGSSVTIPFKQGFHNYNRTSSIAINYKNQNIVNYIASPTSTNIPNHNVTLFRDEILGASRDYKDLLNCVYIGASLTDAEYVTLNTAINEYLIGCLFLKYGQDNWGVKMAKSYFYDLHGFEKYEAFEVYEFIKRHQPDYTYTPLELSVNSGAIGQTDWVDTNADGLADNWVDRLGNSTKSIVTGNGFVGNAQRIENTVAFGLYCSAIPLTVIGRTYAIKFKYRSSNGFGLAYLGTSIPNTSVAANTGNAIETTIIITAATAGSITFSQSKGWLELDEVSVKEVTESDVVNFNRVLNSGFGLATDFVDTDGDGLADGWELPYSNIATSIVTGNGFVKKAQRLERLIASGNIICVPYQLPLTKGKSYTIYCKYRSNIGISLYPSTGSAYNTLPINTENAIYGSFTFVATNLGYMIGASSQNVGSWFEISEILIIDNSNTQFYYNVFGPNGLNRSVSDYILLLKSGGNTASNIWIKSGAATRFCQDGSITNSTAAMPAYTRGSNLGIFTITSIDGWNNYARIDIAQTFNSVNSFYGNFPNILLLKTGGSKLQYNINYCRCKANFNNQGFANKVYNFGIAQYTFPGGINLNISELIGGSYNSVYLGFSNGGNLWGYYGGDVTPFSTEFATASQVLITTSLNLYGSMRNWRLDAITGNLYINNTNISEGTSTWNKTISPTYFSNAAFSTVAVDAQLKVINDYFAVNTPVKNIGITLNGPTMGIPTGGANNTDLLGIIAKFAAAGFTATITVRTS